MPFQPASSARSTALEQVERELQAVGFFGVDVEADVVAARQQRSAHARQQLAHHALVLRAL
jgi:hypothetical protein